MLTPRALKLAPCAPPDSYRIECMAGKETQAAAARLRQALEMHEFGLEMMRQNLRRRFPEESPEQIEARFLAWLEERPDELEWTHGRRVPWPRTGK